MPSPCGIAARNAIAASLQTTTRDMEASLQLDFDVRTQFGLPRTRYPGSDRFGTLAGKNALDATRNLVNRLVETNEVRISGASFIRPHELTV